MKQKVKQKVYWGAIISPLLDVVGSIMILITINALEYTIVLQDFMLLIFWLIPFVALGAIFSGLFGLKKISQDQTLKGKWLCIVGIILGGIILLMTYYTLLQGTHEWPECRVSNIFEYEGCSVELVEADTPCTYRFDYNKKLEILQCLCEAKKYEFVEQFSQKYLKEVNVKETQSKTIGELICENQQYLTG